MNAIHVYVNLQKERGTFTFDYSYPFFNYADLMFV